MINLSSPFPGGDILLHCHQFRRTVLTAQLLGMGVNPYQRSAHQVGSDGCMQPVGDDNLALGQNPNGGVQAGLCKLCDGHLVP